MSNRLDPDQARQIVGSDLGPNCLQRLSADDISRQIIRAKTGDKGQNSNPHAKRINPKLCSLHDFNVNMIGSVGV